MSTHLISITAWHLFLHERINCNIMAGGFRFMPLGLVRLSTWVSQVQHKHRCSRACVCAQSGRVTQRCHNSPDVKRRIASANDITHRKRAEDFGRFWKSQLVEMRPASGGDGWLSLARGDLCGGCQTCSGGGADEKARIERLCLSLLISKNL